MREKRTIVSSYSVHIFIYAINKPGMRPQSPTVHLAALEQNVDVFVNYLTSTRKNNGNIMKAKSYLGLQSSLTYLFQRHRYTISHLFDSDLNKCMEGVKRYATTANQHGEGNIWDGDRPLTWDLCFILMDLQKVFLQLVLLNLLATWHAEERTLDRYALNK